MRARRHRASGPGLGSGAGTRAFVQALLDRATRAARHRRRRLERVRRRSRPPRRARGADGHHHAASGRDGAAARHVDRRRCRPAASRSRATSRRRTTSTSSSRATARSSPRPTDGVFINPTGNPGMATGGTGDVLTGHDRRAGWRSCSTPRLACKLAVYLHGLAGDLAEADEGEVAMTAADLAGPPRRRRARAHRAQAHRQAVIPVIARGHGTACLPVRRACTRQSPPVRKMTPSMWPGGLAPVCARVPSSCCSGISEPGRPPSYAASRSVSASTRKRSAVPTFTLIQEYRGHPTLYHVDLYRLQGGEIDDLGLEELAAGDAIVAIEWAEKLRETPAGAIEVRLEDRGDDTRAITMTGPAPLGRPYPSSER